MIGVVVHHVFKSRIQPRDFHFNCSEGIFTLLAEAVASANDFFLSLLRGTQEAKAQRSAAQFLLSGKKL